MDLKRVELMLGIHGGLKHFSNSTVAEVFETTMDSQFEFHWLLEYM